MKKVSYLFTSVIVLSVFSTGCGNSSRIVQQPMPTYQQGGLPYNNTPNYSNPSNPMYGTTPDYYNNPNNSGYQQNPQNNYSNTGSGIPNSPDMSNSPENSNVVNPQQQYQTPQQIPNQNTVANQPIQQPISDSSSEEEVKVPWYKKVINKVKGIFKKDGE